MSDLQLRLVIAAIVLAIGAGAGWFVTRLYYKAEISHMETAAANKEKEVAEANTKALADAQAKSDDAIARLAVSERVRTQQYVENEREIKRLTTGRPCLSAGVVSLLNRPHGVSDSQREAVKGAADADAGSATDTDVAEWIDTAQLYYGRCQDRVNALIRFYEGDGNASAE